MIVLNDQDLPPVNQEFEALSKLLPQSRWSCRPARDAEISQSCRRVEKISHVETDRRQHALSVIECLETKPDEKGVLKTTKFKWVTRLPRSAKTVARSANHGGRIRWKVENEGFNVQKNGGYGLEPAYTNNATSAKIFHFLLQTAHCDRSTYGPWQSAEASNPSGLRLGQKSRVPATLKPGVMLMGPQRTCRSAISNPSHHRHLMIGARLPASSPRKPYKKLSRTMKIGASLFCPSSAPNSLTDS